MVLISILLVIFDWRLFAMQIPGLVGAYTLGKRPSYAKALVQQQYVGFAAMIIACLKSAFLVGYVIFFTFQTIETNDPAPVKHLPYQPVKLFPFIDLNVLSTTNPQFTIILFMVIGLILLFETAVIGGVCYVLYMTQKIIKLVNQRGLDP